MSFDNNTQTYNLGKQIRMANKYSNVDFYYGPYESIEEAEEYLKYLKMPGLTVLIGNLEDGFEEYWYKDNTSGLTKKVNIEPASSASLGVVGIGYKESSASIPLKLDENKRAYVELTSSAIVAASGAVGTFIHTLNSADGIQLYTYWSLTSLSGIVGVESLNNGSGWIGLKKATVGTLGGIKTGYETDSENRYYGVKVDDNGNAFVNVPWVSGSGEGISASETNILYDSGNLDLNGGSLKQGDKTIIDSSGNLIQASGTQTGGIKVSSVNTSTVTVNSESTTSGRYYPVELNSDGKAIVNVPWYFNDSYYKYNDIEGEITDTLILDSQYLTYLRSSQSSLDLDLYYDGSDKLREYIIAFQPSTTDFSLTVHGYNADFVKWRDGIIPDWDPDKLYVLSFLVIDYISTILINYSQF